MLYTVSATEWEFKPFLEWCESCDVRHIWDVRRRQSGLVGLPSDLLQHHLGDRYQMASEFAPVASPATPVVGRLPAAFAEGAERMRKHRGEPIVLLASGGVFPRSYRRFLGERAALHTDQPVTHVHRRYIPARGDYRITTETVSCAVSSAEIFEVFDMLLTPDWDTLKKVLAEEHDDLEISGYEMAPDEPFLQALLRYAPMESAFLDAYRRYARESATVALFETQQFPPSVHTSLVHAADRLGQVAREMPISFARAVVESVSETLLRATGN